jgi:serine/threonine-protein kinase RsbW
MSHANWTWCCEQSIPSELGAGRQLQEDLLRRLGEANWSEHDIFAVRLAMEEALTNAIKHGNGHDACKEVHVCCRLAEDRLRIEISDQGCGFRPDDVPDCTHAEFIERPSGRGIVLMKAYMCRVEYNEAGNAVILEKHRQREADAP